MTAADAGVAEDIVIVVDAFTGTKFVYMLFGGFIVKSRSDDFTEFAELFVVLFGFGKFFCFLAFFFVLGDGFKRAEDY